MNNGKCPQCGYCSHCGRSNSPLMKPLNQPFLTGNSNFVDYNANKVYEAGKVVKFDQTPEGLKFVGYVHSDESIKDEVNRLNKKLDSAKPDAVPEWLEELMERLTRLEELSEEDY